MPNRSVPPSPKFSGPGISTPRSVKVPSASPKNDTTGELRHPKTGVTVEEAVAKATIDIRSPQVSPVVRYLPQSQYDNVITTPFRTTGPGLTPRKTSNAPTSPSKGNATKSPQHSHRYTSNRSSPRQSYRSEYSEESENIVIVESNGDGTYTPIKNYPSSPEKPRSIFDSMTQEQLYKAQFDMEAEINRLVKANPSLDLGIVEEGTLDCPELKGYLDHIKDQVGMTEKWRWLDMAMEALYSFVSYTMERCGVPMKEYFERLKSKIVDYRQLLMSDPQVADIVDQVIPAMTSSEKKSPWIILGVLILQVIIGCVAAFAGSMKGKAGVTATNFGANMAADQLDGYMFGDKSLLTVAYDMGRQIFNAAPPNRPAEGVRVDV